MICTTLEEAEHLLAMRNVHGAEHAFLLASSQGADPDRCAGGLWTTCMLRGEFESAWQQSDGIRSRAAADRNRLWNGETIEGKRIIVRCLHGYGDAVQMLRYLPVLQQRCAGVIVEVPPRLLDVASCLQGMGEVITWGEHAPAESPAWDVQIEIMQLPYLFRTVLHQLPIHTRYVHLPQGVTSSIARAMGTSDRRRIGIVWSTGEWNRTRDFPFSGVERITRVAGFEFWNLQGGAQQDAWSSLPSTDRLHDAAKLGDGITVLAAVIQQMDLVITADTLAAHLAGAMGVPAWVMLQHAADWRWMHLRSDSPWYPSLRLIRQAAPGDWNGVLQQVLQALDTWQGATQ